MSTQIFDFLDDLRWKTLPEAARHWAKMSLLDLIGVGFSARDTALSKIICAHASESFGGACPLLFAPGRASSPGVALAGAMTIDAIDAHDGWNPAKGHVGCGLLPALYALSPHDQSGAQFLEAFVAGYETGTRLALSLHGSVPDYHTSGAWVAVAVALAGGHGRGLDRAALAHAAGIAEYHGPRSQMMRCIDHPTMVKDGSGWGSMAGVSAVELAAKGFTGAPALTLDGPMWDDLGSRWHMSAQYYKNYPVCRWAQPPVEACLTLQRAHGFVAEDIDAVEIITFHESTRLATTAPETTEEAQYSTAFPVALALAHGRLGPDEVQGALLRAPPVRALAARVTMAEDDHANAVFPAERLARAVITLKNGARHESEWHTAKWDPANPPSQDELIEKFRDYTGAALSRARADEIIATVLDLENRPAEALFALIRG